MGKIILCLVILFISTSVRAQQNSRIEIYSDSTIPESKYFMVTQNNEPDLSGYSSLKAEENYHYICYLGGFTVYDGVNYTGEGYSADYFPTFTCAGAGIPILSMRFAGVPDDPTRPALSLYSGVNWGGEQVVFTDDQPDITFNSSSIFGTGSGPWTLYNEPNYNGDPLCMEGYEIVIPVLVPGSLRSARKGCFTSKRGKTKEEDKKYKYVH